MKNARVSTGIVLVGGIMSLWLWSGCSQDVTAPEPVILPGAIAISSVPSGAAISLDGAKTGLVTPDTINNVLPGSHLLKLSLANYYDTSLTVLVYSNQTTKAAVNLVPLSEFGTLIFFSNPSGAQLFSQSRYLGTTPDTIYNVVPGTYLLVFRLEGYVDYLKNMSISAGQTVTILADWETLGYGSLLISSIPTYAKTLLDGVYRGGTPLRFDGVLAGPHTIELSLPNYLTSSNAIYLGSGRILDIQDSLDPVTIVINSSPSGAKLYVDGNYYGLTPYTLGGVVPEGMHQVKLVKLGFQDYDQSINLAHGDTVNISLTQLFEVIFYDDFNRPTASLTADWSLYEDQWREWPKGEKEPYQTEAFSLALPGSSPTCGYVYKRDSLFIDYVTTCSLYVQQYDNSGYLAGFANGEPLSGIATLPNGISKASLEKYIGQKIQLSFYGCPAVYLDNLLVAGYR